MGATDIPLFDLAERRLAWVDRRQDVLARNIANANTPGWMARDLTPFATLLGHSGVAPVMTDPKHLPGTGSAAARARAARGAHAPDCNGVKIDEELTKVADTQGVHDLVTDLYKKYIGFFKTAIGR